MHPDRVRDRRRGGRHAELVQHHRNGFRRGAAQAVGWPDLFPDRPSTTGRRAGEQRPGGDGVPRLNRCFGEQPERSVGVAIIAALLELGLRGDGDLPGLIDVAVE